MNREPINLLTSEHLTSEFSDGVNMKITCPNCRKNYTFDDAKLTAGIKSARCSACGQNIPLPKRPAKTPPKPVPIVAIACQYCGQSHRLRRDKIPPTAASIKCKACARPVPLSRATDKSPVHSLEKEAIAPGKKSPGEKPAPSAAKTDELLRFACAGCGKKYKISRTKVPPKATAVNCKACGHKIRLPLTGPAKTAPGQGPPGDIKGRTGRSIPVDLTSEKSAAAAPTGKSKWPLAAIAAILLVVALGALAHFNYIDMDWVQGLLPGSEEKTTDSTPPIVIEPFAVLQLNAPLVLNALDTRVDPAKKTARLQLMMSLAKSIELEQLNLYLYLEPNNRMLPVITATGTNRRQLENLIERREPFSQYFRRKSDGRYRLKPDAIKDKDQYQLPNEPYEVIITDDGASLAPVSLADVITANPRQLAGTSVARFSQTIDNDENLAAIAIRLPDRINPGWEEKIQNYPAMQSTPQIAMMAGMGSAVVSQLTDSLEAVEILALGFRFSGQHGRSLSYAQKFRSGVNGEKIYQRLASSNPVDEQTVGIIANLIELFQDDRYQHRLDFRNDRLMLEFTWSEAEDKTFLTALSAATIGQLFAGAVELSPSAGDIETIYATEPNVVTTVDAGKLKANAPQLIKDSLFPGQYWDMGDEPRVMLDLDTVDLPNAALAELTYDVKSVRSPAGKDVLRMEETTVEHRVQPGRLYPGNITINVKKGTPPEELDRARIHFNLAVPVALGVVEFSAQDKTGTVKDAGGMRVTLVRLEKDVAKVSCSGGTSMRLIAYDKTGNALASRESMSTTTSAVKRFAGLIDTLKVVATRDMLEYPFEVDVDLNQGKPLALSREPEIPARMRFNPHEVKNYANFNAGDLKNLAVKWNEGQKRAWNDSLAIKLPLHPFSGHAAWEAHFFDENGPKMLAGTSAQDSTHVSYTVEKDQLQQTNAAFGKVRLSLHSDISRLVFVKEEGRQPALQSLPSGRAVAIAFNKNEITFSADHADVIQTAAYDARGRRLKQDQYIRNRGGKRSIYFWGVPVKFQIDVSAKTIDRLIPFDIERRPVDKAAYSAFKRSIENQRDVVKTIKSIDRARRKDRSYYGDDLAGLYYLYHSKQKKPLALISREIAHSDPAGQKRFGYKVKPFKGYYFTVLSGVETKSVKKDYNRRSKKSRFQWQKGTITTKALTRHPDLVAIPMDGAQPTFFLQWGQVFMKPLNGKKLGYLPDGYYNKGWIEAKYIDG